MKKISFKSFVVLSLAIAFTLIVQAQTGTKLTITGDEATTTFYLNKSETKLFNIDLPSKQNACFKVETAQTESLEFTFNSQPVPVNPKRVFCVAINEGGNFEIKAVNKAAVKIGVSIAIKLKS